MNNLPSSEERILAALAHAAILLGGPGIALPALLWATQKRKSPYLSFQTLQALGFQVFQALFSGIILLVWILGLLISLAINAQTINNTTDQTGAFAYLTTFTSVTLSLVSLIIGIYSLTGLVAAVACLLGKNFHYPWLGAQLEHYLLDAGDDCRQHEEDWVAAMGHASIMMPVWGLLVPLVAWLTGKSCSQRLRFQSAQTFAYQAAGAIIFMVLGAVIFITSIPILIVVLESLGISTGIDLGTSMLAMLPFFVTMFLTIVATLLMPVYSTLPLVAAVRMLKGLNYQYPITGRWAKRVLRLDSTSSI